MGINSSKVQSPASFPLPNIYGFFDHILYQQPFSFRNEVGGIQLLTQICVVQKILRHLDVNNYWWLFSLCNKLSTEVSRIWRHLIYRSSRTKSLPASIFPRDLHTRSRYLISQNSLENITFSYPWPTLRYPLLKRDWKSSEWKCLYFESLEPKSHYNLSPEAIKVCLL